MNDTDPTEQPFPQEPENPTESLVTGAATDASPWSPSPASAPRGANGPRTRWAAIIWGAVFSALAVTVLVMVASGEHRAAFADWANSLTVAGFTVVGVLALGCLVLLLGLLAAVRQFQRRRTDG